MAGLILWATAAFLFMSLLSYSPTDPSFNSTSRAAQRIHNWGGIVGSYLADILLQGLGWAVFLVPLGVALCGWSLLRGRLCRFHPLQIGGGILGTAALAGALHLSRAIGAAPHPLRESGGLVGYLLVAFLQKYLNWGGTWLVVGVMLLASGLLSTRIPPSQAFGMAWGIGRWTVRGFLGVLKWIRSLSRRKKRKPVPRRRPALRSQPAIVEPPKTVTVKPRPRQEAFNFARSRGAYQPPPLSLLDEPPPKESRIDRESLRMNARLVEKKLADFGVEGRITEVHPGPIVTLYEFEPAAGVKISRIVNLHDDLALALRALSVRIIAPIPGKGTIGIEIPNAQRQMVFLREVLVSEPFLKSPHHLTVALGKDTVGNPVVANLASMPHLLIAGATGTGKSVCLNAIITSILFKSSPEDVKFVLIDPKRLELSLYRDIPHLLHPVVVEPKKAAQALRWAVKEMERRYRFMERLGVRDIRRYNAKMAKDGSHGAEPMPDTSEAREEPLPAHLPYIVLVIDELSDLMMVASRTVEDAVLRLAQMARAAGIHLVVATQRPSVDVLTGTIKINLPVRIAFQVTSKFDSRTILDTHGAEHLLGAGDMLFLPPGTASLKRIHGAYVSEGELRRVVQYLKEHGRPQYDPTVLQYHEEEASESEMEDLDEKYDEAVALVARLRQASVSLIQRHLRIGYNRAARIMERMEAEGVVGPPDGSKPREVRIPPLE